MGVLKVLRKIRGSIVRMALSLEKKCDANCVTHKQALAWFNHRRLFWYRKSVNSVMPYVTPDSTIFDVGACIGYFSKLLAKKLDFRGCLYLFEPVPNLANLCRETFRGVPYEVNVYDFGLSDEDGESEMFIDKGGNIGWNTIISEKATGNMERIGVKLRKFDSTGIRVRPSLIKIDVEGSEYKVLRGMLGSLREWRPLPVILCEVGWGKGHPQWTEELTIFGEIVRLGYRATTTDGKKINISDLTRTTDVLFLPEPVG